MKHDSLQHKTSFYAAACSVEKGNNIVQLGYVFVDMVKTPELLVTSGTGEQYKIRIPKDMLNIPSSHQFNYTVEIIT